MSQHVLKESLPNSAALMCWGDTYLVDPELRRGFVRVQVDHGAHKADNRIMIQCDHQAMTWVGQKFFRRGFDDRVIEDIFGDVMEVMRISRAEKLDFRHDFRVIEPGEPAKSAARIVQWHAHLDLRAVAGS